MEGEGNFELHGSPKISALPPNMEAVHAYDYRYNCEQH